MASSMKYNTQSCRLVCKKELQPGIYDFTVESREFASKAQPGQFAHLLVPGKTLRRPISICDADPEEGTLRLVFQVRGEGTELLSQFEEGQVLVGGGIGVPPLLMAAKPFGKNATVILGFRSRDAVILKEDFEKAGCRVILCTDDGSVGFRGLVTEPLRKILEEPKDVVLACGPGPMLKGVAGEAEARGVPCQISLEERMGCGVGACLVCACKIKKADGEEAYLHVCKDGPVFNAEEVVF